MFYRMFKVDYALVGERDGSAGRAPDPSLWRRENYRRGYAQGLIARAERIAQGARPEPYACQPRMEVRP